jgi:hypothetical protein
MSFTATVWRWDPSEKTNDGTCPVTIEQVRSMDGDYRYAVRQASAVLSKTGEWEHEPIPSSRDDAFFLRCRFDSWEEAAKAILKYCKPQGRFAGGVRTTVN